MNQIGWREVVTMPEIGVSKIRAKVDSGATTCALHTFFVEPFERNGIPWVRFGVHPRKKRTDIEVVCESPVVELRQVRSSNGQQEERFVIATDICLGPVQKRAEITLASREDLSFRMLLGRNFLRDDFLVDCGASYVFGKKKPKCPEMHP